MGLEVAPYTLLTDCSLVYYVGIYLILAVKFFNFFNLFLRFFFRVTELLCCCPGYAIVPGLRSRSRSGVVPRSLGNLDRIPQPFGSLFLAPANKLMGGQMNSSDDGGGG